MSIYFGNDTVNDLYIGLTPVSKGYVGTHLFYNGDNTIINLTYEKYILNTQFNTLYNTEEAPIKSAILKGQTLVNLVNNDNWVRVSNTKVFTQNISIKKGQTYTIIGQMDKADHSGDAVSDPALKIYSGTDNTGAILVNYQTSKVEIRRTFINYSNNSIHLRFFNQKTNYKKLMIIEGDYTNADIPYFEGMQSVKMPVLTTSNGDGTKTNILTFNEPVELRGVGKVQDELNLMTGELTERIGEIVLDGVNYKCINNATNGDETNRFDINFTFEKFVGTNSWVDLAKMNTSVICDKAICSSDGYSVHPNNNAIASYRGTAVLFIKDKTILTIENANEWLQQNPITVQYELKTPIVKTVDLSTVNQDGNNTKLSTFNDITHVTLSSEGLIPEAELEVATKNEEVLSTMSLEMDDISTTQNTLEETSNVQSENVDATMIATTEIYEGLL